MKTPIQKIINKLKNLDEVSLEVFVLLTPILSKALDEEKQCIIDAYENGTMEGINDGGEDAEKYYNENYD